MKTIHWQPFATASALIACLTGAGVALGDPAIFIEAVEPTAGPTIGGNLVTLYADTTLGVPFRDGAEVYFLDALSPSVTFVNGSVLEAVAPNHAPGLVDVRVVNPDLDEGLLADAYEYQPVDSDSDGLDDDTEDLLGTDPLDPDTDNDGLWDAQEVDPALDSNPRDADTDDDGIADGTEVTVHNTAPTLRDSDGDGLPDGLELGYTSGQPGGYSDGLGIPFAGTNMILFVADTDPATSTDPNLPDSDFDGLLDGQEDMDHDGLLDARETDPNDPDSDGDTYLDGYEVEIGSDPLDPESTPLDFLPPNHLRFADVPGDQGGAVRLSWLRSIHDAPGATVTITGYGIYRRIDGKARTEADKLGGWDSVGWIAAHGDSVYNVVVPTLCDSTITGACWSVCFVRATTADPFQFFDSLPDSGYSVDNLAPGVPQQIVADYRGDGVALVWQPAAEPDFQYYRIYRAVDPDFVPSPGNLLHETALSTWEDATEDPWLFHYRIAAVDHAGNEGEAGVPGLVSGLPDVRAPLRTALLAAAPNPFNPSTTLAFDLAAAGPVRLAVYDAAGRLVATLLDEHRDAGRHRVVWDGRDRNGRMAAAGVYLYRLQSGSFMATRRMVLLK